MKSRFNEHKRIGMNSGKLLSFGALGAAACIGACAALGFLPAIIAGGGAALSGFRSVGWEIAGAVAFLAAGGVWLLLRSRARNSCACASTPKGEGSAP
jgi:hypothetical protein